MDQSLENKLIVFGINDNEYAISVQYVGAIEVVLPITRVPNAPDHVKGVINLRGVVTPVIDLKSKFHGQTTDLTDHTRIIVVHKEDTTIGLLVDCANDVIDIQAEQIRQQPETVETEIIDYISGVVKIDNRLLIMLDIEHIMTDRTESSLVRPNQEGTL